MMKYEVDIHLSARFSVELEAGSVDEAREAAMSGVGFPPAGELVDRHADWEIIGLRIVSK